MRSTRHQLGLGATLARPEQLYQMGGTQLTLGHDSFHDSSFQRRTSSRALGGYCAVSVSPPYYLLAKPQLTLLCRRPCWTPASQLLGPGRAVSDQLDGASEPGTTSLPTVAATLELGESIETTPTCRILSARILHVYGRVFRHHTRSQRWIHRIRGGLRNLRLPLGQKSGSQVVAPLNSPRARHRLLRCYRRYRLARLLSLWHGPE